MRPVVLLLALALLSLPGLASAQSASGAIGMFFQPSTRGVALGSASTASPWGIDPDPWANPALLGYQRGLRYEGSEAQLVPDFTDDVFLHTNRLTLGHGGIGILVADRPGLSEPGVRIDFGEQVMTDETGTEIGRVESREDIEAFGVGVSLRELQRHTGRLDEDGPMRYFDFAAGFSYKTLRTGLAGATVTTPYVFGEGSSFDLGFLLLGNLVRRADANGQPLLAVDAALGLAFLNFDDGEVEFSDPAQTDPILQQRRLGLGLHAAFGSGTMLSLPAGSRLAGALSPLVDLQFTVDRTHVEPEDDQELWGLELTLLNIFSWRTGHVTDEQGDIDGDTSGWGAGIQLPGIGGFRVDRATRPQADGLSDVDREGYLVWLDVAGLYRELAGG